MRTAAVFFVTSIALSPLLLAQETKPVPKDSVRVSIPGCSKGYVFTASPRNAEQPGSVNIPDGMHLRMNGPKKVIAEIKAHEGSMIEITGLMKKGQFNDGVNIGGGVRISPGSASPGGLGSPTAGQIQIDVESWRQVVGACRSR
jgi:hypothetical protein